MQNSISETVYAILEFESGRTMTTEIQAEMQFDAAGNVGTYRLSGVITPGSWTDFLESFLAADEFVTGMNSVVDLRAARIVPGGVDLARVLKSYAARKGERGRDFRMALLVGDDFSFGVCRMLAVELEQVPVWVRVVRTEDEAKAWALGKMR